MAFAWIATGASNAAADGERPSYERPRLEVATEDGQSALRLHLAAQFRWEGTSTDKGDEADREWSDKILFRRLRVVFEGRAITEDLTYRLHFSLAPGQLELYDLSIAYAFHPQARLLLGQNKLPFTRYRMDSFQTCRWSSGATTPYFGPGNRADAAQRHTGRRDRIRVRRLPTSRECEQRTDRPRLAKTPPNPEPTNPQPLVVPPNSVYFATTAAASTSEAVGPGGRPVPLLVAFRDVDASPIRPDISIRALPNC